MQQNLFGELVTPQTRQRYAGGLGCEYCPLNKGTAHKIKGLVHIKRRKAMVWGMCPGAHEDKQRMAFVGPAGRLLWSTAQEADLVRSDFDIQNVVRCRPTDARGKNRDPTKRELQCCSIYTDEALRLNAESAVVHLILGEVAGLQLLGKDYRKDHPVFWYAPWNAYVVLAPHPSYLLHIGQSKKGYHYFIFRDRLKAVRSILDNPGQYGYIKKQNYGAAHTFSEMEELHHRILRERDAGRNISVDLEVGLVDGKRKVLVMGFGWGHYEGKGYTKWTGGACSVVLYHPQADQSPKRIKPLLAMCKDIIEDSEIKKTLQHGSFDDAELLELLGFVLRGYTYDTQYGSYLKNPGSKQGYSFETLINIYLPEFADYKTGIPSKYDGNFAEMPLDELVLYNCADCDVTKRLECRTEKSINKELLRVYIHDAYVLGDMEKHGPILDREALAKIRARIDPQLEKLRKALSLISGKQDFNPGSPKQVAWLLFDKLKLPEIDGRSTRDDSLQILYQQTGNKIVRMLTQWRALDKLRGTYCVGFENSANAHDGEAHTIWMLTRTATGRLASGKGGAEKENTGYVNLQNMHSNGIWKNCLVTDRNWRQALK